MTGVNDEQQEGWIWRLNAVGWLTMKELQDWADEGAFMLFYHLNHRVTYIND